MSAIITAAAGGGVDVLGVGRSLTQSFSGPSILVVACTYRSMLSCFVLLLVLCVRANHKINSAILIL